MRIIAGELKGRRFEQPKSPAVRPMGEKVRAALFDVVGDVSGWRVLDAYAGSGAAGFEALSRGAASVEAIESNQAVVRTIERSIDLLGVREHYQLIRSSVGQWLRQGTADHYSLMIADPPYDQLAAGELEQLSQLLPPNGILALSHSSKLQSPALQHVKIAKSKRYGDATLTFYM